MPRSEFQLLAPFIAWGEPTRVRKVLVQREREPLTLLQTLGALLVCQEQSVRRSEEHMDLSIIPAAVDTLLNALKRFDDKQGRYRGDKESRAKAIDSVLRAALETKAYQRDRADTKRVDRDRELKLSMLWQTASTAMQEYDHELWQICGFKALGWADSREWRKATVGPEKIKLDKIIEQCRHLQKT